MACSKTYPRRLQDVFKDKEMLRWRRLQDLFITSLQDVSKTYLEDVLQTSSREVLKTPSESLRDQQNIYWEGIYIYIYQIST